MLQKYFNAYSEAFTALVPLVKSEGHKKYISDTSVVETGIKGKLMWALFFSRVNQQTDIDDISDEKRLENLMIETKRSLDKALSVNRYNLATDIIDMFPMFLLVKPNIFIALIALATFGVSIHGTVSEYRHRKNDLNPKMKELRTLYKDVVLNIQEEETQDSLFQKINSNKGTIVDVIETSLEVVSTMFPQLVPGSILIPPLVELPADASSRYWYYDDWEELWEMKNEYDRYIANKNS